MTTTLASSISFVPKDTSISSWRRDRVCVEGLGDHAVRARSVDFPQRSAETAAANASSLAASAAMTTTLLGAIAAEMRSHRH